jgi:Methyltransferase FkbM domain
LPNLYKRVSSGLRSLFRRNRLNFEIKHQAIKIEELERKLDEVYLEMHKTRNLDLPELSMALDPRHEKIRKDLLRNLIPDRQQQNIKLNLYGKTGDGGYYLAAPIWETDVLITAGLADDIYFEMDLAKILKQVISLDHTINQIEDTNENFTHLRLALSPKKTETSTTLDELINLYPNPDYLLKIDIEGAEWDVLDQAEIDTLKRFRMITIEFHHLATNLLSEKDMQMLRVLKKLLVTHFVVVSHPNNYGKYRYFGKTQVADVIEVTYLRRNDVYEMILDENLTNSWKRVQNSTTDLPIFSDWFENLNESD